MIVITFSPPSSSPNIANSFAKQAPIINCLLHPSERRLTGIDLPAHPQQERGHHFRRLEDILGTRVCDLAKDPAKTAQVKNNFAIDKSLWWIHKQLIRYNLVAVCRSE